VVLQFLLMLTIAVLFLSLCRANQSAGTVQPAVNLEVTQT
jgi:hypothetical protein